ncbi:Hypothetical predicted protein [Paramuricea clavata]|uniref:Uncharacterized protein n=1 Tax=Paramuricea clavata TaxID=317549 RepID=A0A7D9JHE8_PARCT|nr:Hypothetical predicted protein [Paramuricea clavata]
MGSDTTLVRKQFVNCLGLPHLGSSTLKFGTAGENVHEELSQDFNLEIKPLKSDECSYKIVASSVVKPCFDVNPIPSKVFAEYEYLTPYGDQIASYGGPVDLLIGRDYAPYIQTLNVLQAPSDPEKYPSISFTKLGCYLFGGIVEHPEQRFATMAKVNFLSKSEDQKLRDFFPWGHSWSEAY